MEICPQEGLSIPIFKNYHFYFCLCFTVHINGDEYKVIYTNFQGLLSAT